MRSASAAALLRIPCTIAALASLAACSLGPRYHRPDIPPPSAWVGASEHGATDWPSAAWWRGFNSSELDGLLAAAALANDDLGAAIARVREADAQRRIAGASLWPAISATGAATRGRGPVTGGGFATTTEFLPLLTASYELDLWGKNRATRRAAAASAEASRFDRQTIELTVMAGVATTYFQVLALRDRVAVAEANLASAQRILKGLELEQQVGTASALDVAQQETVTATLYAAIPALRQQLRQSIDALAVLIGREPESVALAAGTLDTVLAPVIGEGVPSELLARRPDVAEAEAELIAANANVAVARASFFPNITLTGDGGFESSALETLLRPANRIWSATAGLTQPIFQGGALRGQSEYAKARYSELLANYHKAVISAFANVEDSLAAVQQTSEQQDRQLEAVKQAERAYRIAEAQLHAGTINVLTLLNTQAALFAARDVLAQVRLARLEASVNLFKALGGGWQDDRRAGSG